ncbi:ATP-dependent helicase HrpB [Geopsychrobacter electrodiphilus]|uniref:ATP-dependent helicase HrpB n=1 Tax=Geopsychrobacter electrodiphilus TaxID=225196 RepID=UPI0003734BAB|nr:ATP-dependent helicase HrpB [Geopsychrobacter electrodiphilus]
MPLPIDEILPQLQNLLAQNSVLVLEAPPGAGKTTRVPLALLDADWLKGQKILMLEPRRIATRSAAEFMAGQLGEKVGARVGYSIRYEHRTSSQTRLEVITEGILTRRLQSDPELAGVGLVIFDEFHERNIHSDVALALTNDLRKGLREDLKILLMSATLDSEPLCKLLAAERLRSEGRSWPVDIRYTGGPLDVNCIAPMAVAITRAAQETTGDILAFLPGAREIDNLKTALTRALPQLMICPLHGSLSFAAQQLALQKSTRRKLILATNIAETSLTIDGITTVVDSGLCRQPGFDPSTGLTRLQTTRISQASSTQRSGRAGRQGPGVCYRLWSQGTHATLLPQTPPEIRSADLTPLALDLCSWGLPDGSQLDWLDPPPTGALTGARQLLRELGLIDANDRLTVDGRRAIKLPVHPRFASLLMQAERLGQLPVGCLISAFLAEATAAGVDSTDNITNDLRHFARVIQQSNKVFHSAARAFKQLAAIFGITAPGPEALHSAPLAELIVRAYPDRVAHSKLANGDYLLTSGRGAQLGPQSSLRAAHWLATTSIHQSEYGETIIKQAIPLDDSWLSQKLEVTPWRKEIYWDNTLKRVQARRIKRLGAIELRAERLTPEPDQCIEILCSKISSDGAQLLTWSTDDEQFLQRVRLLHQTLDSPWPDLSREQLFQYPENWLAPFLSGIKTAEQLKRVKLLPALQSLLDWQLSQQLGQLTPQRIAVPSGESMKIDYQAEGPVLAVKLQQLFGLAQTPSICRGLIPLKLHLLSPAGRPLAVTSDLRSFWDQVYPEVQKEMKGRYPKHPWPNDPWRATPTRKLKKALK